jgi:hypothetical protein
MTVVNTPARGKVNVALIQIRAATEDKVETCGHMRELVLRAVEEGRAKGDPLHMAVLPVSSFEGHCVPTSYQGQC